MNAYINFRLTKVSNFRDSLGFDSYHSDTSNQISASVFDGKELINSSSVGIIGIGFNKETLTSEAIAVSSNSYKTPKCTKKSDRVLTHKA